MLSQRTEYEQQNHIIAGPPQVALIFVQGPKITEMDFANAQNIITHSLRSHPDLNFVFVTNDAQLAHDLFKEALMEQLTNHTKYFVIQEDSIEIERFEIELKKSLMQLPRRIVSSNCEETYRFVPMTLTIFFLSNFFFLNSIKLLTNLPVVIAGTIMTHT